MNKDKDKKLETKKLLYYCVISVTFFIVILIGYKFNLLSQTYNNIRPIFLEDGGDRCLQDLDRINIEYKRLGDIREGNCLVKNAVRIRDYPKTQLSGPITLSCHSAQDLAKFFDEIKAKNIRHLGSYNCRQTRRYSVISEHGYGTAIDISEIDNASVQKDWNKNTKKGEVIRNAHKSACNIFSNVITPDSNTNHTDHFHLDNGLGFGCLPNWLSLF